MSSAGTARRKTGPRRLPTADAAMAGVILLLGCVLAGTGHSLVQRWRSGTARQQSVGFEDQLGIFANTTGLIVIMWWAMSFTAAVAAALLERSGRTRAAAATGKFSPAFMRRLALASVGIQLLAAPLATAGTPAPGPDPGSLPRPAVSAQWNPATAAAPSPGPSGHHAGSLGPDLRPQWTPRAPAIEPGPLAARQLRTRETAEVRDVTVRAGDSLWSLAAARLGPLATDADIAREWPRLYQANRAVIGDSPHVLRPGQILRPPSGG
ncbi:hypothetical protein [Arthrobacter sp. UYCu712]|uniref:LysM peptidoglycan-binding domain-containing protein n=1 Tax=Arthrobacter sp. UYCu712 TaxID=3156340 RepID=UPI00339A2275